MLKLSARSYPPHRAPRQDRYNTYQPQYSLRPKYFWHCTIGESWVFPTLKVEPHQLKQTHHHHHHHGPCRTEMGEGDETEGNHLRRRRRKQTFTKDTTYLQTLSGTY